MLLDTKMNDDAYMGIKCEFVKNEIYCPPQYDFVGRCVTFKISDFANGKKYGK